MCREQLILIISARTGAKPATVRSILSEFQNVTSETLAKGEQVSLYGFGVFEIKSRNPRIGRNPHNGEAIEIPARVLPAFTPSDALKERVSGQTSEKKYATKSPRISPAK